MKIASWNVRGLGRREKRKAIKRVLCIKKVDMLMVQETKIKEICPRLPRWLWGNENFLGEFVESEGNSGGLLTC
ncbi:hypothetical protein DITRI_Ditri20bG0035300 [Diplodiscus trichospermus]